MAVIVLIELPIVGSGVTTARRGCRLMLEGIELVAFLCASELVAFLCASDSSASTDDEKY